MLLLDVLRGLTHLMSAITSQDSARTDEFALLKQGGEQTLADLFSKYRDRLERMVDFRLDPRLLGRVDPADVLQEAFIEAARRVNDFLANSPVSPFVWIRQVTWQTLLTVHRRHLGQKRNAGREVSLHAVHCPATTSYSLARQLAGHLTSPSQAALRKERLALVRQAIDGMDEVDREVLALRHFEQLGNTEVAEILQIKATAASNRYVRALKRLKDYLVSAPDLHEALR